MSKDPCRPHTGNTQWSMWVCLLTWDCLLHYNFHNMAYKKMFNLIKWGVELKMNWSIPISSGFQFQFNSNSKSFNSIPIQFMLNWIELIINSNSIHELIRALIGTSLSLQKDSSSTGSEVLSRVGVRAGVKYVFVFANTNTNTNTAYLYLYLYLIKFQTMYLYLYLYLIHCIWCIWQIRFQIHFFLGRFL